MTNFELIFGFTSEEKTKIYNYERDRYGSKEKKRLKEDLDWKKIVEDEKKLFTIPAKDRLHNKWWDMTTSRFWQEIAQCDVTYFGITTKFKRLPENEWR
tara:strand:- start:1973 stop:2269 length:297 start_codon:yes stop_codon:yes gene_type:complete